MRKAFIGVLLACAFAASTASAQDAPPTQPAQADPQPPTQGPRAIPPENYQEQATAPPPRQIEEQPKAAEKAAVEKPLFRDDGLVLGLDFAFGRSVGDGLDRLNAGSPSALPIGLSGSFRTSQKVMFGMHAHAALASREDCSTTGSNNCTARDYGIGAHVESALGTPGATLVPWFRYGLGWEMLYRGGYTGLNDAYSYRHAFKLLDIRFGADFVVHRSETGKTTRIGPFLGMITGISVGDFGSYNSGGFRNDLDRPNGDAHFWFLIGMRATTDP